MGITEENINSVLKKRGGAKDEHALENYLWGYKGFIVRFEEKRRYPSYAHLRLDNGTLTVSNSLGKLEGIKREIISDMLRIYKTKHPKANVHLSSIEYEYPLEPSYILGEEDEYLPHEEEPGEAIIKENIPIIEAATSDNEEINFTLDQVLKVREMYDAAIAYIKGSALDYVMHNIEY